MTTPFDDVYDKLWELVEDWPAIDTLVRKGNRVKFDDFGIPVKESVSSADLPELILVPASTVTNLQATSSSTSLVRDYDWLLSTGTYKLAAGLNAVEWAIFITHLNWSSILGPLLYDSQTYVKRLSLVNGRHGISDRERNRGVSGWSAVWRVQVEMHFKTSSLMSELTP